ncbi:hypothetical protein [Pseudalgibacter alginicilyticus]|uniref:hypothetical protein n=1 Tax=Pseudalgibacter alginicilyticus TaxID=1736674 RepID=UPI0012FE32A9|nr:hypothetical protein [Pseudalgibacter alginicilyticus]
MTVIKTNDDGRFYIKRTRKIAKESITEMNNCTTAFNESKATIALQIDPKK